jgi:TonB dependent receptor
LTELVPGVMPPVINDAQSNRGGFSVGGQQETANYDTLDGFNDVEAGVSGPAVRPSIDDIQEFKIYSGTYEAQYGHNVGGQVVLTTKSGGNAFHGGLFEFVRNQIFDAENYFNPLGQKPAFSQNDYGGTVGGPILHNKLFFFFSYEGLQENDQFISKATVPTTAEIGGNFSSVTTPLTAPANYANNTFINNVLNLSVLTPDQLKAYNVAQALLLYYPATTTPGGSNYFDDQPEYQTQNQYALRLDDAINAKNSMYATLNYFNNPFHAAGPGHVCSAVPIPGFDCFVGTITQLYGGGWTHLFTPNLINTLRAGYQRLQQPKSTEGDDIDVDDPLGIPNNYDPTIENNRGVPSMAISGYQSYGDGGPQNRWDNTYDYGDALLYSKGTHSFNFGVEVTRELANAFTGQSNGSFTFTGVYTGNALADTVLGLPAAATLGSVSPIDSLRYTYIAAYVQDTWKVSPKLTLNYGLRWEKDTPVTTQNNQAESFNLTTGQPYLAGTEGSNALYHAENTEFEPRIGLSYRPFRTDRTVIQAGFGITYDTPNELNTFFGLNTGFPLIKTATYQGTTAAPLFLPDPFIGTGSASSNVDGINPHFHLPTNTAYTFGVQEQLARNTVLTLNYQGSETAHENTSYNINQAGPQSTAAAGIANRPYKDWNTVSYVNSNTHSGYNALYTKVQQNLTHGLSFLVAYTWSKSIDNDTTTPENIYNLRAERGLSTFDVRNRFVASPVYDLPFGAGRQYLNHGWAGQVVGGWEVAGEIALQNGTPVTPILSANVSNDGLTTQGGTVSDRPNVSGDPNNGPKKLSEWFNTAAYSEPASGTFGDAGRNTISSPGYKDVDINISRSFILPRKMSVQFRAEMFNAFNHPNFEFPGVSFGTPSFGTISAAQNPRQIQFAFKLYY